jgi:hypothetical protein
MIPSKVHNTSTREAKDTEMPEIPDKEFKVYF